MAGVPIAPSTPPVGRNGLPMMNAIANTAKAAIPSAIGALRVVRRWSGWVPLAGATPPAITPASSTPQPGHAPPAPAQHLSHANTRQDGHIDSPIPARVAAGPIKLRQR